MNIFYLDRNHKTNVSMYVDSHVSKMNLEYSQMLSTCKRVLDSINEEVINPLTNKKETISKLPEETISFDYETKQFIINRVLCYKATHHNHPCNVWIRESKAHFNFLQELAFELSQEFTFRYKKIHKSSLVSSSIKVSNFPTNQWLRDPPQAIPDVFKVKDDCIQAYRNYYKFGKLHLANWSNRPVPDWFHSEYFSFSLDK